MSDNTTQIQQLEDLDELITTSLAHLKKDRDREILIKRHGINATSPQTLEQIGSSLGITRERVRQIERAALTRIQKEQTFDSVLNELTRQALLQQGGIITFDNLHNTLNLTDNDRAKLSFLIKLDPDFHLIERNDTHDTIIILDQSYSPADIKVLHELLIDAIKTGGKPAQFKQIAGRIDGIHAPTALEQLATSSNLIANLDGRWGLAQWPEVNPKSIRDKVYLVLKKAKQPLHFSQIAAEIENVTANPKKVTTQAVHNELIKDDRFVLIGRGIYALAEWGYQAGTVADIIEEILKQDSPLSKDEIVRRVSARRQVKVTTIILNLQEKPQFERVGKATYQLKRD